MKTQTVQQNTNAIGRRMLSKVSSAIVHFQSNPGRVAQEGAMDDPNDKGDITNATQASTVQVADLAAVFADLNYVTRQGVLDALGKAHAMLPATTGFSKKGKR